MAKLIVFEGIGYSGRAKEYRSNDPNLTLNGDDFTLSSAVAIEETWTLFPEVNYRGEPVDLDAGGGPDADGTYKDPADWSGAGAFHVKSIRYS